MLAKFTQNARRITSVKRYKILIRYIAAAAIGILGSFLRNRVFCAR